jgi:hypothetical protein
MGDQKSPGYLKVGKSARILKGHKMEDVNV